jgi:hypothetical protein
MKEFYSGSQKNFTMYRKVITVLSVLIIFTDLTFGQTDNKKEQVISVTDLKSDLKYLKKN